MMNNLDHKRQRRKNEQNPRKTCIILIRSDVKGDVTDFNEKA